MHHALLTIVLGLLGTGCSSVPGSGRDSADAGAHSEATASDGSDTERAECETRLPTDTSYACQIGLPMPDFTLKNCAGGEEVFSDRLCASKCTLFSLTANWDTRFGDRQPLLQRWYETYGPSGLMVLTVLRENSGPSDMATTSFCRDWTDRFDLTFPVLIDPLDRITGACLSSQGFPAAVLVAHGGEVVFADYGDRVSTSEWELQIEACLAE